MNDKFRRLMAALAIFAAASTPAARGAGLGEALTGGKVHLDMRYRFAYVTQDNPLKDATASTLGTRLGYMSGTYHHLQVYLEASNVSTVIADDFNSTRNAKTGYSVVADPTITVLNRAYLSYSGVPGTRLAYGRQRIVFDNARFIGNVGWRQTEQTYDAVTVTNESLPQTKFVYVHMTNANRVTGVNAPMHTDVAHVTYSGVKAVKLSAYAYLLDFVGSALPSSKTFGVRLNGSHRLTGDWAVLYSGEYARQSDYADNPAHFGVNYWRAEAGARIHGVTLKGGYEVLGSDGRHSLQTPLATLHAMNGWADQFLVTPAQGLVDRYASAAAGVRRFRLLLVYHNFKPDTGDGDLGSEWDLKVARPIGRMTTVMVIYAGYRAGGSGGKVDTDKVWLMGRLKF